MKRIGKKIAIWLPVFLCLLNAAPPLATACGKFSGATGFTTPTEIEVPLNSVTLTPAAGGSAVTLWSGTTTLDFKRSAGNFANISIGTVTITPGRYSAITWSGEGTWSVELNGTKYTGADGSGTGLTNGASLYTTGSDAGNNSLATSGTAVMASDLNVPGTGGQSSGYTNFLPQVVCIKGTGVTCQSTDEVLDPSTTPIHITFIMDLDNTVLVDANYCALAYSANSYPAIVFGDAGAAVHISGSVSNQFTEGTLIFDNNSGSIGGGPRLVYGSLYTVGGGNAPTGLPFVGSQAWGLYTASSGTVEFPLGNCGSGSCISQGTAEISNVKSTAGTTLTFSCVNDATSNPYGSSFPTQTGSECASGNDNLDSGVLKIVRIVDPSGILGSCPSGAATQVAGSTGTCAAQNTSTDGYP